MPTSECPLCQPESGVIARTEYWTLILNENQATLGRVYLALNRHETDITNLTPDEQRTLWESVAQAKRALVRLFAPDHFNYMFHMNLTPHVHFHIYPRYATPREFTPRGCASPTGEFAGHTFLDSRYGDHYDPAESRTLDHSTRDALAAAIREALASG